MSNTITILGGSRLRCSSNTRLSCSVDSKPQTISCLPTWTLKCFLLAFLSPLILGESDASAQVQLTNAFPALTFTRPIFLTHAEDGTGRVFVVQQDGIIRVFPNDSAVTTSTVFLNITNKLSSTTGEEGLLGLAFHPDYENNGYFYVNYTAPGPLRTVVARYSVRSNDPNKADSLSELVILTVNQPFSNHNGGMLLFGLDRYLYIGLGDGGSAGDPQNHGQNLQSLLGKILRIDIDTTVGPQNYGIPPTNPFAGDPLSGREELYAWGYRNPWRFSLDESTGMFYVGDVGQGSWEEIDVLELGLNYGWRCYEGNAPYNTSGCGPITNYTFPIKVYSHSSSNCSVTGGYVYRGYRRPELTGAYIYGDYCTGRTWMLRYENGQVTADSLLIDAPFSISSFGKDQDGELYICNYGGNIQRFVGSPLAPSIPCDSIDQFQARCQSGGTIQARIVLRNSTQYAGEEVVMDIDGTNYPLTVVTNGMHSKAQVQLTGQSLGDHSVALVSPAGCFDPVTITCATAPARLDEEWMWVYDLVEDDEMVFEGEGLALDTRVNAPTATELLDNYPDPFNPSTTIRYALGQDAHVSLRIYNMLGQLVATLVDQAEAAGYHQVVWDGSSESGEKVASGIYIYRLSAGHFVATKRMLLLK